MHSGTFSLCSDHCLIGTYQVRPSSFSWNSAFKVHLYLDAGYNMDFGRMLIHNPPTHVELAQPFSPDLARQWGFDVMCLPYNILPFDSLDKARSLSYSDAVVSENLRFNPQSLKMRLVRSHNRRFTLRSYISTGGCLSCSFTSVPRTIYL